MTKYKAKVSYNFDGHKHVMTAHISASSREEALKELRKRYRDMGVSDVKIESLKQE